VVSFCSWARLVGELMFPFLEFDCLFLIIKKRAKESININACVPHVLPMPERSNYQMQCYDTKDITLKE